MTFYGQTESKTPKAAHPSLSRANRKEDKFIYWNRDEQIEKEYTLPKEFVIIADSWSIKGWLESKGGVWSNEIYSFANDPFVVKNNSGETLYSGLRKDIKDSVKAVRLGLTKNIHIFDPDEPNEIRTICLKGAGLKAWMDVFKDDLRNAPAYKRIKLDKIGDGKVGKVTFQFPIFTTGADLTAEDRINQQKLGAELMNYKNQAQADAEVEEVKKDLTDDTELPF